MRTHKRAALWILLVPACFLLSCSDDSTGPQIEDPTGYPAATTIEILLDNLLESYDTMNLREYERLLDESFTFVFDPRDVGELSDYRATWPVWDEMLSTENIFSGTADWGDRSMQSIRIGFVAEDPTDSDEGEGWKRITLSTFELEAEMIHVDNGETWFLRTGGGYEVDLTVRPNDGDPPIWKIMKIVDRPPPAAPVGRSADPLSTEPMTWGRIRGMHLNVHHDGDGLPPARTIRQLLDNFLKAHHEMDYDEYASLLGDPYEFIFETGDLGEDPDLFPDSWSREEDLASMANLFGGVPDARNRVATDFAFLFEVGAFGPWEFDSTAVELTLDQLEIEVAAIDQGNEETWFLRTPAGYRAHCTVLPDPSEPTLWKIIRIIDDPPATLTIDDDPPVRSSTWGAIKALWR